MESKFDYVRLGPDYYKGDSDSESKCTMVLETQSGVLVVQKKVVPPQKKLPLRCATNDSIFQCDIYQVVPKYYQPLGSCQSRACSLLLLLTGALTN